MESLIQTETIPDNVIITPEYLAGFFDGEGSFFLGVQIKTSTQKEYPRAQVILSQSGEDGLKLLEKIQLRYGGVLYLHVKAGEHKATKNAYKLYWNKDEAIHLIRTLEPFLILKKEQALNVLRYLERKK